MNVSSKSRHHRFTPLSALTRLEVMVIIAGLALLVMVALPPLLMARAKRTRIACVNNLNNIGLAFRIGTFALQSFVPPWRAETDLGGTIQHATNPAALWRHFAAISNEISHPKLFICPSDRERRAATSWSEFTNNRFVSYALGLSVSEESPQSILGADRNLRLDGAVLSNAIISFSSNALVTFDRRLHNEAGNLLMGDGSVQQVPSHNLSEFFRDAHQATGTNVLAFP